MFTMKASFTLIVGTKVRLCLPALDFFSGNVISVDEEAERVVGRGEYVDEQNFSLFICSTHDYITLL